MSKEDLEGYEEEFIDEEAAVQPEEQEEAGEILDDDDLNAADTDKYDRLVAEGRSLSFYDQLHYHFRKTR